MEEERRRCFWERISHHWQSQVLQSPRVALNGGKLEMVSDQRTLTPIRYMLFGKISYAQRTRCALPSQHRGA